MLGSLFIGNIVTAIEEALDSAEIDGVVGVVEHAKVGAALSDKGRDVILFSSSEKAIKKQQGPKCLLGTSDSLPIEDGALDAVIAFELGAVPEDQWESVLVEWTRATRDGGVIIVVDKAAPTELTRRALCGGLAEIQQRPAGRSNTVTSGLVTRI